MDDRFVLYDKDNAGELELAYAMTVHKSQGNEFQAVIIPMFSGAPQLSYRNLLYTAITRAKNLLILVGTENAIQKMVENDRKTRRYSGLYYFLTGENENESERTIQ
jgi:exodeoxyribonuclease V alpha subunit